MIRSFDHGSYDNRVSPEFPLVMADRSVDGELHVRHELVEDHHAAIDDFDLFSGMRVFLKSSKSLNFK